MEEPEEKRDYSWLIGLLVAVGIVILAIWIGGDRWNQNSGWVNNTSDGPSSSCDAADSNGC